MSSKKPIIIKMNIGDQLTSVSCSHIVVELIKFLAYQRLQIPYSYQWLKEIINKRKACEEGLLQENFQTQRHFRTASTALENLDFILKGVQQEINGPTIPDEVCIALGGTPVTCKEVYRLLLPTMCHKPQCQSTKIANDQKIQRSVFRNLVTSEKLSPVFVSQLSPTNLFVFIKKKLIGNQETILNLDNFVDTTGCRIPRNSKIVVIDFKTVSIENMGCCNDFQIFGDIDNKLFDNLKLDDDDANDLTDEYNEIESTDAFKWYQSSYVMKGFKDCVVNGRSVTNMWLHL